MTIKSKLDTIIEEFSLPLTTEELALLREELNVDKLVPLDSYKGFTLKVTPT
jgi:hypothetical protein